MRLQMKESGRPRDPTPIPVGYRSGVITAITVVLGFSFLFLRSWAFELPGESTRSSVAAAVILVIAIILQFVALWRSLQLKDEAVHEYQLTLRWFLAANIVLLISLITAAISYSQTGKPDS